jgi:nucleoside-diphosphate-sugar epimerase
VRVVITGGCGFLGRRVALRLLERREVDELVLFDNAPSALPLPEDRRLKLVTGDIADRETVRGVVAPGTNSVFHLAAVVSGEAEADTDLGYRVNLDGARAVLEACRALGTCPRLVFASSLAVYGGALPPAVGDDTALTPETSYGTQKAIGELLVNDNSRKGFVDGRAPCACRPSSCGPAGLTAPPRPLPPRSFASLYRGGRPSVRSRQTP